MNLYAYVHNAPLTHFDEYGLMMTGRDYRTAQQIANASWEGDRPWSTVSHYGRHLASRMAHDVYDYYAAPLIREFDQTTALFSQGFRNTEQAIWGQKQGIDHLFRTNIATADQIQSQFRQQFGMEFAQVGILYGPAGLLSGASRVSTAIGRLFRNVGALSPARKLSTNATSTRAIADFWPPNRGFIGNIKQEYLMPGKIIDRYGNDTGKFVSSFGTAWGARSLPEHARKFKLTSYEVVKPFEVKSGIISPAFEQMGLGVQYELPLPIYVLRKRGIIREVNIWIER